MVGERLFAVNPVFGDGTRLREAPCAEAEFNGVEAFNDWPVRAAAAARLAPPVFSLAADGCDARPIFPPLSPLAAAACAARCSLLHTPLPHFATAHRQLPLCRWHLPLARDCPPGHPSGPGPWHALWAGAPPQLRARSRRLSPRGMDPAAQPHPRHAPIGSLKHPRPDGRQPSPRQAPTGKMCRRKKKPRSRAGCCWASTLSSPSPDW